MAVEVARCVISTHILARHITMSTNIHTWRINHSHRRNQTAINKLNNKLICDTIFLFGVLIICNN